jgi:hypothetical protein
MLIPAAAHLPINKPGRREPPSQQIMAAARVPAACTSPGCSLAAAILLASGQLRWWSSSGHGEDKDWIAFYFLFRDPIVFFFLFRVLIAFLFYI